MARRYRVVVEAPTTQTAHAKTWEWDHESGVVLSIENELKKEHQRVSNLTVRLSDPGWAIFSALPDPAFSTVPFRLYLAKPGNANDVSYLVFDGKLTRMSANYSGAGASMLVLVGHDKSVDMRRQSRYRTFANKTSVQIAQTICNDYGFSCDVDADGFVAASRAVDIGAGISDWDMVTRALDADGFECFMDPQKSKTLVVRRKASVAYATTFRRGEPPILSFQVDVQHIRGESNPDKQAVLDTEQTGTVKAVPAGGMSTEATRAQATDRTHRVPVGTVGAKSPWTNRVDLSRRRKDTATLTVTSLPDFTLRTTASVEGFGAKADGKWYADTVTHVLVSGEAAMTTRISIHREPSGAADKAIGASGLNPESTAAA